MGEGGEGLARVARAVSIALNPLRLNDLARVARAGPPRGRACAHGRGRACPPGPARARVCARPTLSILSTIGKSRKGKGKTVARVDYGTLATLAMGRAAWL